MGDVAPTIYTDNFVQYSLPLSVIKYTGLHQQRTSISKQDYTLQARAKIKFNISTIYLTQMRMVKQTKFFSYRSGHYLRQGEGGRCKSENCVCCPPPLGSCALKFCPSINQFTYISNLDSNICLTHQAKTIFHIRDIGKCSGMNMMCIASRSNKF